MHLKQYFLALWKLFKQQTRDAFGCMAARVKVCVCGLGLLPSGRNGGPVCEDSATEGGMCKCGTISESALYLFTFTRNWTKSARHTHWYHLGSVSIYIYTVKFI